jgi:hypothetical protein
VNVIPGAEVFVVGEVFIERGECLYKRAIVSRVTDAGVCYVKFPGSDDEHCWGVDGVYLNRGFAMAEGRAMAAALLKSEMERHANAVKRVADAVGATLL